VRSYQSRKGNFNMGLPKHKSWTNILVIYFILIRREGVKSSFILSFIISLTREVRNCTGPHVPFSEKIEGMHINI